ncbi:MAG: alkaline phosphatase PhoX, partial [Candidatus Binatia bacterium]
MRRDDDTVNNSSTNKTFQEVVEARVSRRGFLGGGLATAASLSLGGVSALLKALPASAQDRGRGRRGPLLGFQGIPVSAGDTVVVPHGYTAEVLIAWGDPVADGPEFKPDASNSAADQALQWGMHNDGVVYFPIYGSRHGLLVQNNEYTDDVLLFPDGLANWNEEKTNKALNAHGVSIIEIKKERDRDRRRRWNRHRRDHDRGHRPSPWESNEGEWEVVSRSKYGRRITGQT